jgi:hypothetical protein
MRVLCNDTSSAHVLRACLAVSSDNSWVEHSAESRQRPLYVPSPAAEIVDMSISSGCLSPTCLLVQNIWMRC